MHAPPFFIVTAGFAQASDLCRIGFLECLNLVRARSDVCVETAPTLPADSHRRHPGYGKHGLALPSVSYMLKSCQKPCSQALRSRDH
jgi:hypothetical protein